MEYPPVLVGKYMFKGSIFQPAMLVYRRVNLFDMPLFLRYYRGAHGIVRPSRVVAPKLPADATWMYGKWTLCWCSSYKKLKSSKQRDPPFGKLSWQWKIHHLCIVVESPRFPGSSLFSIWLTVVTLLNLWPCGLRPIWWWVKLLFPLFIGWCVYRWRYPGRGRSTLGWLWKTLVKWKCVTCEQWKKTWCWVYIGGYTTQLYRDHNKPL